MKRLFRASADSEPLLFSDPALSAACSILSTFKTQFEIYTFFCVVKFNNWLAILEDKNS